MALNFFIISFCMYGKFIFHSRTELEKTLPIQLHLGQGMQTISLQTF